MSGGIAQWYDDTLYISSMGQGIAAHLANAGVPSVLYDIVPRDLPEGGDRRVTAREGIKKAQKLKPYAKQA